MAEADLALQQLRQNLPGVGSAQVEEDTQSPPGSRTHHFHYELDTHNEPHAYAVDAFMASFVEFMEDAGFVPRRLWTEVDPDSNDSEGGVSFSLVITSAEQGGDPQWALELEGYIPPRSKYPDPKSYPADIEGSIVEGAQAVQALVAKHEAHKWDEAARKILTQLRLFTQGKPEKMVRLYQAMEAIEPDGVLKVLRAQLVAGTLDEQTSQPAAGSTRPRF